MPRDARHRSPTRVLKRVCAGLLVLAGASSCGPSSIDTGWQYVERGRDESTPFHAHRTGHRLIRAHTSVTRKLRGATVVKATGIEWGWMVDIENLSDRPLEIDLTFELKDDNGIALDRARFSPDGTSLFGPTVRLAPRERRTVQGTKVGNYDKCKRATSHECRYSWRHPR